MLQCLRNFKRTLDNFKFAMVMKSEEFLFDRGFCERGHTNCKKAQHCVLRTLIHFLSCFSRKSTCLSGLEIVKLRMSG